MSQTFQPEAPATGSQANPQAELEMPGLEDALKKKVNRPIPELPLSEEASRSKLNLEIVAGSDGNASAGRDEGLDLRGVRSFVNQSDAPACPNCGHVTVRNGACYKCLNCGESLGCS